MILKIMQYYYDLNKRTKYSPDYLSNSSYNYYIYNTKIINIFIQLLHANNFTINKI